MSSCTCAAPTPVVDAGTCACEPKDELSSAGPPSLKPVREEPTTATPRVAPLPVCQARGRLPLDAARAYFDDGKLAEALSCAAQAAALSPDDPLAHGERGNALAALERVEEAGLAYARALAIDPDSLDALAGAAHLYAVQLPSSREHDELGSLYAERGFELARGQDDEEFAVYFARLSAMAFNDVGRPRDALARAEWVLGRQGDDHDSRYERAVALFELCRFDEARRAFAALEDSGSAFVHQHLGLLLEREGRREEAGAQFARARALDPQSFTAPVAITPAEFTAELEQALAELTPDMKADLEGVPVTAADLPALEDLTGDEEPLSPTILGLFRGPPLGEPCEGPPGCRSVVLYRLNLARAVKNRRELAEQIRVTLLHEVGHLRGEDDGELAARGLE